MTWGDAFAALGLGLILVAGAFYLIVSRAGDTAPDDFDEED